MDEVISDSIGWAPYTAVANMTGRPAVSIPLHWTAAGLPLGVQLLGRLGADGDLLRVAAQLERVQPWVDRFPALPCDTGRPELGSRQDARQVIPRG